MAPRFHFEGIFCIIPVCLVFWDHMFLRQFIYSHDFHNVVRGENGHFPSVKLSVLMPPSNQISSLIFSDKCGAYGCFNSAIIKQSNLQILSLTKRRRLAETWERIGSTTAQHWTWGEARMRSMPSSPHSASASGENSCTFANNLFAETWCTHQSTSDFHSLTYFSISALLPGKVKTLPCYVNCVTLYIFDHKIRGWLRNRISCLYRNCYSVQFGIALLNQAFPQYGNPCPKALLLFV